MKKLLIALLLAVLAPIASAYGIATFTGRVEYLGYNRLMCEYMTSEGMVFAIMIQGGYCPHSINL